MSRWARETGGFVRPAADHAQALRETVRDAIKSHGTDATRSAAIDRVLCEALTDAYAAGVREGRSAYQAEAGHLIRDQIMRAFSSVALEHAPCPHCLGRGCADCGNVGKRPRAK